MMVRNRSAPQISFIPLRDTHVEIDVSIVGLALQRFLVGVERGLIVAIRVMRQTEKTVGLGILWIYAERSARLRHRIVGVIAAIEVVGKLAMCFRKTGHQV